MATAASIDPVTLDLIENALKNARFEMDEVVRRAAMSPTIREQHDEFPMIANDRGEMVVGQFGSNIPAVIRSFGAEARVVDICNRFGRDTYMAACDALLERTRQGMIKLVHKYIPEEKVTFWDWVDDDGLGNGPFKLQLTIHREGDVAVFDWTGTDPQAPGSINFHIHESLCKLFFGVYLIMAFDPTILFNEGYNSVFKVILPEGSLLNPKFPAALSNRLNVHTRFFDCQSGALGQKAPELSMAAGYGTSPYFVYHGEDENGDYFQMVELLFGGLPGRPVGDGLDGHSWWPLFRTTPAEYMESYYPVVVERYEPVMDTGGAGLHRGGCGIEKQYLFLRPGAFTVNDDRAVLDPWGSAVARAAAVAARCWCAPTARARSCRRRSTTCRYRPATG